MLDQKNLQDYKVGEEAKLYLLITKIEKKITRTNKEYLNLELRDKSSSIPAKMWGIDKEFYSNAAEGSLVKAVCIFDEFNGAPQLKIESIRLVDKSDNVAHEDFLPVSARNFGDMENELHNRIAGISDEYLIELLRQIFDKEAKQKYYKVPAGKAWHHAYIHGLLEHTLEIIKICDLMCDIHSELKRDLLITAAILHDFGKTEELTFEKSFDYTDKGRLLGHIVIAATLIEEKSKLISGFPEDLKNHLIHLILSHQGRLEHASPVIPKTAEAIVLYHADELSAKSNAYINTIKAEQNEKTNWTSFIRLADTALYSPAKDDTKTETQKETFFDI